MASIFACFSDSNHSYTGVAEPTGQLGHKCSNHFCEKICNSCDVCMYIFLILGFLLTKWVTEIFFFLSNSLSQINDFRFRRPCILSIYYLMYVSVRLILDSTTYLYNEETLKESLALGAIY